MAHGDARAWFWLHVPAGVLELQSRHILGPEQESNSNSSCCDGVWVCLVIGCPVLESDRTNETTVSPRARLHVSVCSAC